MRGTKIELLGREIERRRVALAIDDARRGRSSALLISGDAGVGKTTMLVYASLLAEDFTVLSARGIESESDIGFAGLSDLLRPLTSFIEGLPGPQAAAISGALGLEPGSSDRFSIYAATLGLLGLAAEKTPLMLTVDDAQWLDTASQSALRFAARRLHAEGVVLIATVRTGEFTELHGPGIDEIVLGGLSADEASELIRREGASSPAAAVVQRLVELTMGNPLALIECSRSLSPAQLAGTEPLPEPLPTGATLQEAFARRLQHLDQEARRALTLLAASDSTDKGFLARALTIAKISEAALTQAEDAGVLSEDLERLDFQHPLIRSAAYHTANAEERRRAHGVLAEACREFGLVEQRAWHLARSTLVADEVIASALEETAQAARQGGAHGAAAEAFERAAVLTSHSDRRARRLLEAASEWHVYGNPERALRVLDSALGLASNDPLLRADIALVRGRTQMWSGAVVEARDMLLREAESIEATDPARGAMLAIEAVGAACMTGRLDSALPAATWAHSIAMRVGGVVETLAAVMLVLPLVASGERERARSYLEQAKSLLEADDPAAFGPLFAGLSEPLMWLGEDESARTLVDRMITTARARALPALLPYSLAVLAQLDLNSDRFTTAHANASEGVALALDTGQENQSGYNLACLALVEAALGKEEDCRRHVKESIEIEERFGGTSLRIFHGAARGHLELSLARPRAAVDALEAVARFVAEGGARNPEVGRWGPNLIESYLRSGRRSDAGSELVRFETRVEMNPTAWGRATVARCRALLAGEDYQHCFEEALDLHAEGTSLFERARTQLCYGERLRARHQSKASRDHLGEALEIFEALPASAWAQRARSELALSGGIARSRRQQRSFGLTPQELQVALIVARGATNKEAAAQLFLSPKTIEHHLGHAYAKLGVRSRTELANVMLRASGSLAS